MISDIKPVQASDFLTFTRETPPHVKIESVIIDIGGGAKKGVEFKKAVMANAGWKYKELTSYGAYAETAANAFNRVREVLTKTKDKQEILDLLKQATS